MPVEEVGQRIDLSDPAGRLNVRLVELLEREARMFNIGITCGLKDRQDTVCSACPVCEASDPESTLGKLCKVGREQELVTTELAVLAREHGSPVT